MKLQKRKDCFIQSRFYLNFQDFEGDKDDVREIDVLTNIKL